jgi:glutaredoxin
MNKEGTSLKRQECTVVGLILSWLFYPGVAVWLGYAHGWVAAAVWLAMLPVLRWALYRYFASASRFLGYGRIADTLPASVPQAAVPVTFYSFFSCPFCPIVLRRLIALQQEMGFTLEQVDVTRQPQLLMSKGIRAVPVVEAGGRRLVGNASTEQLAELIAQARPTAAAAIAPAAAGVA